MARILVVDDDADMREVITLALDGQCYDIDRMGSGQAASISSRSRPPTSWCVICTCRMWTVGRSTA